MSESILSAIDAEISRLKQARALLSSAGSAANKRRPGRPANAESVVALSLGKTQKRGKMSAEARERIRQAQIKRWAAVRRSAKPDAIAAAVAPPKLKKKAAKTTDDQ